MKIIVKKSLLILTIICSTAALNAIQTSLFEQIRQLDEKFFTAFNQCDLETMGNIFSKELEFYHDTSGFGDYESNMLAGKNLCDRNIGLVRTLVPNSLEVYPIKDFGAMQIGRHTFCHSVDGKPDCGTFGFVHVWKQTESGWVIHRVMSYGH